MTRKTVRSWYLALIALTVAIVAAACSSPAATPAPTAAPAAQKAAAPAPTSAPAVAAPTTAPAAQPLVTLRAGIGAANEVHVMSRSLIDFADRIGKKSNGEIKVQTFFGSLGGDQQLADSVISGSVDIGTSSNGNLAHNTDAFYVYDLPYLFKNYDELYKSLKSPIGQAAFAKFEKDSGVKVLYNMNYGSGRDLQTRGKALKVPADVKGLKIRVVSTPVDLATVKAWGANPTPVDYGQLFAALQQGVVDGEAVPVAVAWSDKHQDVIKYGVRVDYQLAFNPYFINKKKFDSLSPAHQKAIQDAAQEAEEWNRKDAAEYVQKALAGMKEAGVQYYTPTPEEFAQWSSVRESVWKQVAEEQKGKIDLNLAQQILDAQK